MHAYGLAVFLRKPGERARKVESRSHGVLDRRRVGRLLADLIDGCRCSLLLSQQVLARVDADSVQPRRKRAVTSEVGGSTECCYESVLSRVEGIGAFSHHPHCKPEYAALMTSDKQRERGLIATVELLEQFFIGPLTRFSLHRFRG